MISSVRPGRWHTFWQSKFAQVRHAEIEKKFPKLEESIKNRRADVYLRSEKVVIEIQHSCISQEEVENRNEDYKRYGLKLFWLIDATDESTFSFDVCSNISVSKGDNNDNDNERYFLTKNMLNQSKSERKPYSIGTSIKSFENCPFVFFDIGDDKIVVAFADVMSTGASETSKPISYEEFLLMDFENLEKNTLLRNVYKTVLYKFQLGAGNGKTYQAVRFDECMKEKCNFLYVTKTHSAKEVIFKEFCERFPDIEFEDQTGKIRDITINGNRYMFATIDRLFYSLKSIAVGKSRDLFSELAKKVFDDNIDEDAITSSGNLRKLHDFNLSKQSVIIVDEAQDLAPMYVLGLLTAMRYKFFDTILVGDVLQSIYNSVNSFNSLRIKHTYNCTEVKDFHQMMELQKVNVCHRFGSKMAGVINRIMGDIFNEHNVPRISVSERKIKELENSDGLTMERERPIEFMEHFSTSDKTENMNGFLSSVKVVLQKVRHEVLYYKMIPRDFLFICSITKNNYIFESLVFSLNELFRDLYFKSVDEFPEDEQVLVVKYREFSWRKCPQLFSESISYAHHHISEDNRPVDLQLSKDSCRLVSVHASKGDGRKVVFLLNVAEQRLKRFTIDDFSENDKLLKYHSLLHVALTRSKEKMYIGMDNKSMNFQDDVFRRLFKAEIISLSENWFLFLNQNGIICNLKTRFKMDDVANHVAITLKNIENNPDINKSNNDEEQSQQSQQLQQQKRSSHLSWIFAEETIYQTFEKNNHNWDTKNKENEQARFVVDYGHHIARSSVAHTITHITINLFTRVINVLMKKRISQFALDENISLQSKHCLINNLLEHLITAKIKKFKSWQDFSRYSNENKSDFDKKIPVLNSFYAKRKGISDEEVIDTICSSIEFMQENTNHLLNDILPDVCNESSWKLNNLDEMNDIKDVLQIVGVQTSSHLNNFFAHKQISERGCLTFQYMVEVLHKNFAELVTFDTLVQYFFSYNNEDDINALEEHYKRVNSVVKLVVEVLSEKYHYEWYNNYDLSIMNVESFMKVKTHVNFVGRWCIPPDVLKNVNAPKSTKESFENFQTSTTNSTSTHGWTFLYVFPDFNQINCTKILHQISLNLIFFYLCSRRKNEERKVFLSEDDIVDVKILCLNLCRTLELPNFGKFIWDSFRDVFGDQIIDFVNKVRDEEQDMIIQIIKSVSESLSMNESLDHLLGSLEKQQTNDTLKNGYRLSILTMLKNMQESLNSPYRSMDAIFDKYKVSKDEREYVKSTLGKRGMTTEMLMESLELYEDKDSIASEFGFSELSADDILSQYMKFKKTKKIKTNAMDIEEQSGKLSSNNKNDEWKDEVKKHYTKMKKSFSTRIKNLLM